jgi:hypothetical protein
VLIRGYIFSAQKRASGEDKPSPLQNNNKEKANVNFDALPRRF